MKSTPLVVVVSVIAGAVGSVLVRPLLDARPASAQSFVGPSEVGRYQLVQSSTTAGEKLVIDTKTGEVWQVINNAGLLNPKPWPRLGKPGGLH